MRIPKDFIAENIRESLKDKKEVAFGDYKFRVIDERIVEVTRLKKYRSQVDDVKNVAKWIIQ